MLILIFAGILIIAFMMMIHVREGFVDLSTIPEPQRLLKQMRSLMEKYDKPEVWDHITQVMDKDPGQLARMNLGITN
jgi:hypothetical protein